MSLSELFTYDSATGHLFNRVHRNARSKIGRAAGHISDSGYVVTRINGKIHRAHRIVWEMHNGPILDGQEIDHINRIRTDNRIENLRLATRHEQNLNLSQRKSFSGHTGVVFNKKDNRWQAQIGFKGRQIYLGQFVNKTDAIDARKSAEINYGFRG
jgi:hypothetical protein